MDLVALGHCHLPQQECTHRLSIWLHRQLVGAAPPRDRGTYYGGYNNPASNIGRTLARIGDEMQYIGKSLTSVTDQSAMQGSEYRQATVGLSGSGPQGTSWLLQLQ